MSKRKKGCLGCGGALLGFFIFLVILGLIVGPQKTATTASTVTPTSTATSTSTPTLAKAPAEAPTTPKSSPKASLKPSPAAPSPSATQCQPGPDIIVWFRAPGVDDSSETLGSKHLADCTSTFAWLQHTSPTGDGYCTQAAWASDNPGYNADTTPALPLQNVQVSIGPACPSADGSSSGGSSSSGGGSGSATILSPSGNYYRAGEFCPHDDDGLSTVDANGNTITCSDVNGYYRWHY